MSNLRIVDCQTPEEPCFRIDPRGLWGLWKVGTKKTAMQVISTRTQGPIARHYFQKQ